VSLEPKDLEVKKAARLERFGKEAIEEAKGEEKHRDKKKFFKNKGKRFHSGGAQKRFKKN
jgi:hypothetical protein